MSENTKSSGTNDVDWSRFGLSDEKKIPGNGERELSSCNPTNNSTAVGKNNSNVKELFEEDQVNSEICRPVFVLTKYISLVYK